MASKNHGKTNFWAILVPPDTCTLSALGLCRAAPLPMTLLSSCLGSHLDIPFPNKPSLTLQVWVTAAPLAPRDALAPHLGRGSMLGPSSQKGVLGRMRTMVDSPSGTPSPTHDLAPSRLSNNAGIDGLIPWK